MNQNVKKEIDEAPGPWYLWDIELDREIEAAILRLEIEAKTAHDAALIHPMSKIQRAGRSPLPSCSFFYVARQGGGGTSVDAGRFGIRS
jgi:hypothetical protein